MNETGHTPGPWTAHVGNESEGGIAPAAHPHWCEVASKNLGPNGFRLSINGHFGIANARLIAAAPDMLAALKNIENDDAHMPSTAWDLIQAAISKAEGRA